MNSSRVSPQQQLKTKDFLQQKEDLIIDHSEILMRFQSGEELPMHYYRFGKLVRRVSLEEVEDWWLTEE